MRLILMGTGPFAVPSFETLAEDGHEIALVITRPLVASKSRRRPPPAPVRQWATGRGLPIEAPQSINAAETVARLRTLAADLLVVCDYGQILRPEALQCGRLGGINLHGSLLPKYRGAAPVQWAVLSGDRSSGVTVIHMTPRLDGGPILTKRETEIRDRETAGELEQRLAQIGVEATRDAVAQLSIWDGNESIGSSQDASLVSRAPRLSKSDGEIDWARSAREIDCHVRGMQPWPVAFSHFRAQPQSEKPDQRLAILEIAITDRSSRDAHPGEIDSKDGFHIATDDSWVRLDRLRPAGKREMSGAEFLRGNAVAAGMKLF